MIFKVKLLTSATHQGLYLYINDIYITVINYYAYINPLCKNYKDTVNNEINNIFPLFKGLDENEKYLKYHHYGWEYVVKNKTNI